MSNKHFCQGPRCHEAVTQDRFLKSRGVVRGRYAYSTINQEANSWGWTPVRSDAYFCSQGCKNQWLNEHMENIEHGRPIEFIRHRRESQGYEKVTEESDWGRNYTYIKRVDNRTELD
jgi:hypothetical protein